MDRQAASLITYVQVGENLAAYPLVRKVQLLIIRCCNFAVNSWFYFHAGGSIIHIDWLLESIIGVNCSVMDMAGFDLTAL